MTTTIYLLLVISATAYLPLFPTEEFETPKTYALITFFFFSILLIPFKDIKYDKVGKALFIFILSCLLSTVFSLNKIVSVFGNPKMPNGLLVWLSYLGFYLVCAKHLKSHQNRIGAVRALIGCSLLVSIYAIAQAAGIDFKQWFNVVQEHGYVRPPSTLGHPNFTAAYLAMIAPFCFWNARSSTLRLEKYISFIALICCSLAIALSLSRGMWLATMSAFLAYMIALKLNKKTILVTIAAILSFFCISLGISTVVAPKSTEGLKERVNQITTLGSPRIEYLKGAMRIFNKYPIIGAGLDNFEHEFRRQRTEAYWSLERGGSPHRAHLEPLNVLATQGIVGLIALIFLCYEMILRLKNSSSMFKVPAISSVTAFYVQELSSFHCVATVLVLIICLTITKKKQSEIS